MVLPALDRALDHLGATKRSRRRRRDRDPPDGHAHNVIERQRRPYIDGQDLSHSPSTRRPRLVRVGCGSVSAAAHEGYSTQSLFADGVLD
jgi:hypothetical protein